MRTWPEAGFLMLSLGGFSLVLYILFGEFCFDQQRLTFVFCSCQVFSRGEQDNWKVWWWPLEEVRKEGEGRIPYYAFVMYCTIVLCHPISCYGSAIFHLYFVNFHPNNQITLRVWCLVPCFNVSSSLHSFGTASTTRQQHGAGPW